MSSTSPPTSSPPPPGINVRDARPEDHGFDRGSAPLGNLPSARIDEKIADAFEELDVTDDAGGWR
jgi:hypothetical protein